MKKILSPFIWLASRITGRKNFEKALIYCAKAINADLLKHAQIQIGGSGSLDQGLSGEHLFITGILPGLLETDGPLVFFDVGANVGNYSLELRKYFPAAKIYSFEPVKNTFNTLVQNTGEANIHPFNIGFSESAGTGELFNTASGANTEIASVYKEVFNGIFKDDSEIVPIKFTMDTLDEFCAANTINNIHFLKIDVEGHELAVLKGAGKMLLSDHIKVIQFEFNSHNVYSRVFLRDFYLLLEHFEFYRILHNGIARLGPYTPLNEIFVHQNFVAVHQSIHRLVNPGLLRSFNS